MWIDATRLSHSQKLGGEWRIKSKKKKKFNVDDDDVSMHVLCLADIIAEKND